MAFNPRQILIIVAAVVVIAAAGIYYVVSRPDAVLPSGGSASAPTELMVAGPLGEMTLGDPKAPNTVIEYASLTCSHCERFHSEVFPELKTKYIDTGKVHFIYRSFSLNDLDTAAIMLTFCVPKERYFPLVDLLYDRQADWTGADPVAGLKGVVKQAGIGEDAFTECLKNQSILDGVNAVRDRADKQFGVASTPTFFVNGTKMTGEQTIEEMDKALGG